MSKLPGKTALVTGGSKGIGAGIAKEHRQSRGVSCFRRFRLAAWRNHSCKRRTAITPIPVRSHSQVMEPMAPVCPSIPRPEWWPFLWCNAPAATSGRPAICFSKRPHKSFRMNSQTESSQQQGTVTRFLITMSGRSFPRRVGCD
jgi:hypothetical protein